MLKFQTFALVLLLGSLAYTQDFSADLVSTSKQGKQHTAKIYVSSNKMRIETAEMAKTGAAIVDFANNSEIVVMDQQHMYMQMPLRQLAESRLTFWRPDPTDACPQWQKMAATFKDTKDRIASCRKVGNDVVNGRPAIKYEGTSAEGKTGTAWVDPKLRYVIKWQGTDSSMEVQNIHEGSQPASLFEPPAGYRKFEMPQGMQAPQHQ
jgi:outer membrane lipoprotein-sorting protein